MKSGSRRRRLFGSGRGTMILVPLPLPLFVDDAAVDHDAHEAQGLRTRMNNIEYFSPNFEGLVLGCIDADFCK